MTEKLYPITPQQRELLEHDLTEVRDKLEDLANLVRTCCGEETEPDNRAAETLASLQRLQWALERTLPEFAKSTAGATVSAGSVLNQRNSKSAADSL